MLVARAPGSRCGGCQSNVVAARHAIKQSMCVMPAVLSSHNTGTGVESDGAGDKAMDIVEPLASHKVRLQFA